MNDLFQALSLHSADTQGSRISEHRLEKYGYRLHSIRREIQNIPRFAFVCDETGRRHAKAIISHEEPVFHIVRCQLLGFCQSGSCVCSERPELTEQVRAAVRPLMGEFDAHETCNCPGASRGMLCHDEHCPRLRIGQFACCNVLYAGHVFDKSGDKCSRCNATKAFIDTV